jgi:hypothetical protein
LNSDVHIGNMLPCFLLRECKAWLRGATFSGFLPTKEALLLGSSLDV